MAYFVVLFGLFTFPIIAHDGAQYPPHICPTAHWSPNGITVASIVQSDRPNSYPSDLAVNSDGSVIWMVDFHQRRVQRFDINRPTGVTITRGTLYVESITIDEERGLLYVYDFGSYNVLAYPLNATSPTLGIPVYRNVPVGNCQGLAVDKRGLSLFMSDTNNARVLEIDLTTGTQKRIMQIDEGREKGRPANLFFDPRDHSLYVSDTYNGRILKFSPNTGANATEVITGLSYATGHAGDRDGTLYLCDRFKHQIIRWQSNALQGTVIVGTGGWGSSANQLTSPVALRFDANGNLFVLDHSNYRVQRFQILHNSSK